MRTKDHRIEVRDSLMRGVTRFEPDSAVTFPVRPPVHGLASDVGGGFVRLRQDEGWIEVRLSRSGTGIEIRAAQALTVEPRASNSVVIRLADDEDWTEAHETRST